MLQESIYQLDPEELYNAYFQHDGVTAHTARTNFNLNLLRKFYDGRSISSHTDRIYPPRSPDLTPLDYFLFPTLKNAIFKHQ